MAEKIGSIVPLEIGFVARMVDLVAQVSMSHS